MSGFLKAEEDCVNSLSDRFDSVVEVGCMEGRYLTWAVKQSKNYTGVDIVPKYIEAGLRRIQDLGLCRRTYRFLLGAAEDSGTLIQAQHSRIATDKCLLLFPFNSFGNIASYERLVANLAESGIPFLISTYSTTKLATQLRREYYARCGYADIEVRRELAGVCIVGSEGLHSMAYYPDYLDSLLGRHGLKYATAPLAKIGIAYASHYIVEPLGWRSGPPDVFCGEIVNQRPDAPLPAVLTGSDTGEICRARY
jgi:hypothetical protein